MTYRKYAPSHEYRYGMLGHLFILFFAIDFICYMGYAIKAGVFAEWYFATWEETTFGKRKKWGGEHGISPCPTCASCCRVTRYHMGSIAFAAFLVAVIQMIQVMV